MQYPFLDDLASYEALLCELLSKKDFRDIFYTTGAKVFCEKEVANSFGDLKRIDRLIIRDAEAWVIDYKSSGSQKDDHFKQAREYMNIIEEIYPGLKVRGFLLYLDELTLEEVWKK